MQNDLKVCLGRFLGNYCPPRSTKESRLLELKKTLSMDKHTNPDTLWILNRIYDTHYLDDVKTILNDNQQQFSEIPFVYDTFKNIKDGKQKLRYVFNLNNARNTVVTRGLETHDYVICADGDLFMDDVKWNEMLSNIQSKPDMNYYVLWHHRVVNETKNTFKLMSVKSLSNTCHSTEPVLIFTNKSTQFFDERLYYNDNCKNELCFRIGLNHSNYIDAANKIQSKANLSKIGGTEWTTAGVIYHLALDGTEDQESSVVNRCAARAKAIQSVCSRVDDFYNG